MPSIKRLNSGTEEQEAVWDEATTGTGHLIVEALAGTGKSSSLGEAALRIQDRGSRQRMRYLAFNKPIEREMTEKYGGRIKCSTYHGYGFSILMRRFKDLQVNDDRMWGVVRGLKKWTKQEMGVVAGIVKVAGKAKEIGAALPEELEELVEMHQIDLGDQGQQEEVLDWVPLALQAATEVRDGGEVDFADMLWLPAVLNLPVPRTDLVLADEVQDLNALQHWLTVEAGERVIAAGDRYQAIYTWRGALEDSMNKLAEDLGKTGEVKHLPLTYTRRCPNRVVEVAKRIVPDIKAMPGAKDGAVRVWGKDSAGLGLVVGDLVLCRMNAPIVNLAFKLLRQGVRARIVGRDIGEGIKSLLPQGETDLGKALKDARNRVDEDVQRYLELEEGKGQKRAAALMDKWECLMAASFGCRTVGDLEGKLKKLFEDDGMPAVRLSTVHRAKGLEAERVRIIEPGLMPHPKSNNWQEEMNLIYVAVTRSMGELEWAGKPWEGLGVG